ncbi:MAG: hypothetical protein SFV22_19070 [Saprospiraceae bacterium]|nr:hypothetical protein [Saprospiraceae bacterium]
MMIRVVFAALSGGLTHFLLGWVTYGVLLASFSLMNAGTAYGVAKKTEEMEVAWVLAGSMAYALLLTLIFVHWARISTFKSGAIGGLWIGLLVSMEYHITNYGTSHLYNLNAAITYSFADAMASSITGGIVGWTLGFRQN